MTDTDTKKYALSDTIRRAREAHGLSQLTLAERLGVSQAAINHWETGRARPGRDNVERLAVELGVPPLVLLGYTNDEGLHPEALELAVRVSLLDDRTRRALLAFADAWLTDAQR